MNRTYLIILIIVGLGIGFVAGWFASTGGPSEELVNRVDQLETQIGKLATKQELNELAQRVEQTGDGAVLKVGYVNAEKAFKEFKGTEEVVKRFLEEKEKIEAEAQKLRESAQNREITEEEYQTKVSQLQAKYQEMDQLLTQAEAAQISNMVDEIADEENYDLVTREKNVLLYLRASLTLQKVQQAEEFVEITEEELDQEAVSVLKTAIDQLKESGQDKITYKTTSRHVDALMTPINVKSLEKYEDLKGWNNVLKYGENFYKVQTESPIHVLTYKVIDRMNERSQEIVDQVIELLNQYLEQTEQAVSGGGS